MVFALVVHGNLHAEVMASPPSDFQAMQVWPSKKVVVVVVVQRLRGSSSNVCQEFWLYW